MLISDHMYARRDRTLEQAYPRQVVRRSKPRKSLIQKLIDGKYIETRQFIDFHYFTTENSELKICSYQYHCAEDWLQYTRESYIDLKNQKRYIYIYKITSIMSTR